VLPGYLSSETYGVNNPRVVFGVLSPRRADGAAEATNRSGLTAGYLGNLGTDTDPEIDQVDINARGSIVGNGFGLTARAFNKLQRVHPVLWACAFGR